MWTFIYIGKLYSIYKSLNYAALEKLRFYSVHFDCSLCAPKRKIVRQSLS